MIIGSIVFESLEVFCLAAGAAVSIYIARLRENGMKAQFSNFADSTKEDCQILMGEQMKFMSNLPERILQHMALLEGDFGGFPVDRLQHCLQTAERAAEAGEDDEYVVCALLHDIGDTLGSYNHADVAAAILQPFVSEANYWLVKHHGVFQGYNFFHHLGLDRNMRDQFKDSEHFEHTARFIEKYDSPAFDQSKPVLSLELFAPLVRKVMAAPKQSLYKSALEKSA
ncbi:MAG: putative HD phosphohydrolase [Bermanella sp.]|jgi:predicted HD phosphohydrolase